MTIFNRNNKILNDDLLKINLRCIKLSIRYIFKLFIRLTSLRLDNPRNPQCNCNHKFQNKQ